MATTSIGTPIAALQQVLIQNGPGRAAWIRSGALLTADILSFAIAVVLSFAVSIATVSRPLQQGFERLITTGPQWHGWGTFLVLASLLAFFGARGQYTARVPFWSEVGVALSGITAAILCDTFIKVAVYGAPYGSMMVVRWLLLLPVLLALRQLARTTLDACGLWTLRTLVVGDHVAIDCATNALRSDSRLGYKIVGTEDVSDSRNCDHVQSLMTMMRTEQAEFVVVAMGNETGAKERAIISALARERIMFALVPTFKGLPVLGFTPQYFFSHDILLLVCRINLARPFSRLVKHVFDQTVALLLLLLLSPLLLVLISMVRMDGGRAFYGHKRVGANGLPFQCLKFRSMVVNADQILNALLKEDANARQEWAETQKLRDDPRVTRIGRFLRKTSLDELPQLINVVRGEMSLVGPRPIVDAEVVRYGSDIDYYFGTRPGMTGLWQISGRSNASYARRVQLDVWYVRNWTLWHDIMILLKTLPAVLRKEGAI